MAAAQLRLADEIEDDKLALVLTNAFLPVWNHNWFHSSTVTLEPLQYSENYELTKPLTASQKSRKQFYYSLIRLARLEGGDVLIASVPREESNSADIGAVLLWTPPNSLHLGLLQELPLLYRSGFLNLILPWHYGLAGLRRIAGIFEPNVDAMFNSALKPRNIDAKNCAFVRMIASNPRCAGMGYASQLLKWRIEKHFAEFPAVPVALDTTTMQGVRAYERLGFELLGERSVDTGTDAKGIKLRGDANESTKDEGMRACNQYVMIKMPD